MKLRPKEIKFIFIDNAPGICITLGDEPMHAVQSETDKLREFVDKYKEVELEVKRAGKGRSLDANAYMWLLCDKIAQKLSRMQEKTVTKEEIYRRAIKSCGVFRQCDIDEKAADTLVTIWSTHGTGWIAEKVDFAAVKGFVRVNLYYGSSTYNSRQMSRLVDSVVQDAKSLAIETMTPDELANLKSLWGTEK